MKINLSFIKKTATASIILSLFSFAAFAPTITSVDANEGDEETARALDPSEWIKDGFPLLLGRDGPTLRALWKSLETPGEPFADAVYLQLRAQGKSYKGKPLRIKGRLLRGVKRTFDESGSTFYDLWVLLPDARRDPIRVLSQTAPEGFQPDERLENAEPYSKTLQYRDETLEAIGIYYRGTAYDAGDDLYTVPTFVASGFRLSGVGTSSGSESANKVKEDSSSSWGVRVGFLFGAIAIWLIARRATRRNAGNGKKLEKGLGVFLFAAATFAFGLNSVFCEEEPELDEAGVLGAACGTSREEWLEFQTERRTELSGRAREVALTCMYRLTSLLDESALKERGSKEYAETTLGRYASANARGKTFEFFSDGQKGLVGYFVGTLESYAEIKLNALEQARSGLPRLYRVQITTVGGVKLTAYTATRPRFEAPEGFHASRGDRRVAGLGVAFGYETSDGVERRTVLNPRLAWVPTSSPLGASGLDLASYSRVPVYAPDALVKSRTERESRAVGRSLRFTANDAVAFYETLAAVKRLQPSQDKNEAITNAVELFNHPERNQGRRVKLRGWVRRANLVLIDDASAQASTGLDRYYQICLFTNESEGHPLILCVPDAPQTTSAGGSKEASLSSLVGGTLEFDGYFYKTWAYRKGAPKKSDGEASELKSWTRAPTLIGRVTRVSLVDEETDAESANVSKIATTVVYLTFFGLAVLWIVLRRTTRKSVRQDVFEELKARRG